MNCNFIIGTGRCGTTILGQVLNNHSRICVPPELQIILELHSIFSNGKNFDLKEEEYIKTTTYRQIPYTYNFNFSFEEFFKNQQYPIVDLKELLNNIFNEILNNNQKQVLIKQVPWYGQHIDIIKELFPNAKYIHIIRDGRDVAMSMLKTGWWTETAIENLVIWNEHINNIFDNVKRFLEKDDYIEIKYENLVNRPKYFLKKILNFLNLSYEEEILYPERIDTYEDKYQPWVNNISSKSFIDWNSSRKTVFFSGQVFNWKKNKELFNNIPENVKKTLIDLGYYNSIRPIRKR